MAVDPKSPTFLGHLGESLPSNNEQRVLTRQCVADILSEFLRGKITASDLQNWASDVELREQIEYEPVDAKIIADVLFELSTPEIYEPLTVDRGRFLLRSLGHDFADSGITCEVKTKK